MTEDQLSFLIIGGGILAIIVFALGAFVARIIARRNLYWWAYKSMHNDRVYTFPFSSSWGDLSTEQIKGQQARGYKCTDKFYAPSKDEAMKIAKELLK